MRRDQSNRAKFTTATEMTRRLSLPVRLKQVTAAAE
jgi:hypothetical protein